MVIDRVSARCGCEYEWGVHMAFYGEKAGVTPKQAYSLVHGDCTDACWTDEDRTTLTFVDELHDHGRVSDATWAAMRVRFSDATLIELLVLAGWYHAIAYLASNAESNLKFCASLSSEGNHDRQRATMKRPLPARPGRPVRGSRTGRPVMALLDLLGRRWTLRVLSELRDGPVKIPRPGAARGRDVAKCAETA